MTTIVEDLVELKKLHDIAIVEEYDRGVVDGKTTQAILELQGRNKFLEETIRPEHNKLKERIKELEGTIQAIKEKRISGGLTACEGCEYTVIVDEYVALKYRPAFFPWQQSPLDEWSIVGMNHYYIKGEKFIFIAMMKGHDSIKAEGKDTPELWEELKCQTLGIRDYDKSKQII